jgi:hypothetical protein
MSNHDGGLQPPQPPEFRREFRLHPYQYIMLPLIFVIPLLALLGIFGEMGAVIETTNHDISLHVDYTSRIRFSLAAPLTLSVTNQTSAVIDTLIVSFDQAYLAGFSRVNFTPDVMTITGEDVRIDLGTLQPGETRTVVVDLQAEKVGRYTGEIRIEGEGIDPLSIHLETVTFP